MWPSLYLTIGRESHCDSVDIFAAAPQFANTTNIIIVIVSIVIASIVTVTIVSIIMSSLPWQVAWENPWHPECLICMGKLMDVVMGKPMAQKSESFNGGGRHC